MTVLCKRTVLCKYIYKENGIRFAVRYGFDCAKDALIDKNIDIEEDKFEDRSNRIELWSQMPKEVLG